MFGYNNKIVSEDLKEIISSGLEWNTFEGKTVLVTGANGMLATYITYTLIYLVEEKNIDITILVLTRSLDSTKELYGSFIDKPYFKVINQDISTPIEYSGNIDYIFHLAGNASPYHINNNPVDIMRANLIGTFNIMELAIEKRSRVFFASTREVYGRVDEEVLHEESFGSLDSMDNRSCYPESKRAAESIIRSYWLQYKVDGVIARIAHSYGPGMKIESDGRVMSDFIGNAVRGEDIVLNSRGDAVRAFIYLTDAVTGIFTIMLKGRSGEAYNLSNETEAYPIYEIAKKICDICKDKGIKTVFAKKRSVDGYCKYPRVALDNSKLISLGFIYKVGLEEGIRRTIESYT